jgi:hypothetical protein
VPPCHGNPLASPPTACIRPQAKRSCGFDGRNHYLGKHDSTASHERYNRLLAEILARPVAAPRKVIGSGPGCPLKVVQLCAAYWQFAEPYYCRDGRPSGHVARVKSAIGVVRELYARSPAEEFGPLALQAIQGHLVAQGLCRNYLNAVVGDIQRIFKWGVSQELVSPSVYQALACVCCDRPSGDIRLLSVAAWRRLTRPTGRTRRADEPSIRDRERGYRICGWRF